MIETACFHITNTPLNQDQTNLLRGYLGNIFREYNLISDEVKVKGKALERYPLIQMKMLDDRPVLIALTKPAVAVLKKILLGLGEIKIKEQGYPVKKSQIIVKDVEFGEAKDIVNYQFATPWISFDQLQYTRYKSCATELERKNMLKQQLLRHIQSLALGLAYQIKTPLEILLFLRPPPVMFKKDTLIGFRGGFAVNCELPEWIGLGKSVSRGFGTVERYYPG